MKKTDAIKAGDVLILDGLADAVVGVDERANSVFCAASRPTYNDDGTRRGTTTDYSTLYAVALHDVEPVENKPGWWRLGSFNNKKSKGTAIERTERNPK
jgi:hypothetical protein